MPDIDSSIPYRPFRSRHYNFKNLTGRRFGNWFVFGIYGKDGHRASMWLCRCSCGRWCARNGSSLMQGISSSCKRCVTDKSHPIHGYAAERGRGGKLPPELASYYSAKSRCTNPNAQAWANYGGRGIQFRFTSFEQFLAELGHKPTPQHSLDRIDNDGHYEPGNVRWAERKEQGFNRRTTQAFTIDGETHTLTDWCEKYGIDRGTVSYRLKQGWGIVRSLTHPVS